MLAKVYITVERVAYEGDTVVTRVGAFISEAEARAKAAELTAELENYRLSDSSYIVYALEVV